MNMRIKKTKANAIIPTKGSEYAAGFDLYAALDENSITIEPGQCVKIDIGFAMEIPIGYFGGIFPRSGLATKQGLRLANSIGVVDSDFRGSILVPLYNDSDKPQVIENGMRIAQFILIPCQHIEFKESDELSDTSRSTGGFGSTGVK